MKEGDNPYFETILHDIIQRYGTKPASTLLVLKGECPKYRLQCQQIEIKGALKAITEKRPVVATFGLTGDEHQMFAISLTKTLWVFFQKMTLTLQQETQ